MLLTFNAAHIRQLLDMSKSVKSRNPVADQIYDPAFWRDDMPEDRKALLASEIAEQDFPISARSNDVDPGKIPEGLILVGDRGVYLMSQAPREACDTAGVAHVCYAAEVNPETLDFDAWWDAKRASFGGDDGTVFLPADALDKALSIESETLALDVTPDEISIMTPQKGPSSDREDQTPGF